MRKNGYTILKFIALQFKNYLNLQNLADSHFLILMFGSLFLLLFFFNN